MGIEEEMDSDNYKGSSPEKDLDTGSGTPEPFNDESTATDKLTGNTPKIKFSPSNNDFDGKNGEAKIDIKLYKKAVGMGKEELLKYANDPFWIRLRLVLFVSFWLLWIAMLVGAIAIVILTPKCDPKPTNDWYQESTVYVVDTKAFKDSNDDGRGDIKGLIEKVDYLKKLGIGALVLNPIFEASNDNDGYDVLDHMAIDETLGTLEDFDSLVETMKENDIKIILDFIPNHSSKQHTWFKKSENREDPYTNYYVWKDANITAGGRREPPNNWLSVHGGSAWEWSSTREQYYLHQFHESQPDLNLNDPALQEELKSILQFWLERGVSAFRVDAVGYLFEDMDLGDEQILDEAGFKKREYDSIEHKHTFGLEKTLELLVSWNEFLNTFKGANNSNFDDALPKILLTPTFRGNTGFNNSTRISYPFNQILLKLNKDSSASELVNSTNDVLAKQDWPTYNFGGVNDERLATRWSDKTDGIIMLTLLNKGTPLIYFGDEIGIEKLNSPMLWSNTTNAGFSAGTSSLPIDDNYQFRNVENQEVLNHSRLKILKKLVTLRKQNTIQFGQTHLNEQNDVIVMIRVLKGNPGFLVAFNVGNNSTTTDLTKISSYVPMQGDLEMHSTNVLSKSILHDARSKIQLDSVPLDPGQAVVFSFVPNFS